MGRHVPQQDLIKSNVMKSPRRFLIFLGFLPFLLAGCSDGQPRAKAETVLPVLATRAELAAHAPEFTYSGEVRARYETAAAFRLGGQIVDRYVDVGSLVKPGQALARIDPKDYQLSEQGIRSQIQAAEADYEQARRDLDRFAPLLKKKFISQAEFDRRQNAVDLARARLDQLKSQLAVSRNQVAYTVLRADEAGIVTAVEAERGQVVAAGQPVFRLARLGEKEVVVGIPENRLDALHGAKEIHISVWAAPGKVYQGRVREVSPIADPATRTYAAKIAVLNPDDALRLGMTATVTLEGAARRAVYLPLSALYRKQNQTAVWVIDPKTQRVKLVPVDATAFHDNQVAITRGLEGGEEVVTAGVNKLFPDQKVRVLESAGS